METTGETTKKHFPAWHRAMQDAATEREPNCFILARKGSKRLKNKNKLDFLGKPLVLRAIETAQEADIFDNIVVSSDDMEIIEIAYEANIDKPHKRVSAHLRPKRMATDRVQQKHVCRYLARAYNTGRVFCLLSPCNPFVKPEDLVVAHERLWRTGANYVMSVIQSSPPPQLAMIKKKRFLEPMFGHDEIKRSQELEKTYHANGGFIFARKDIFDIEFEYGFYGSKVLPYVMRDSMDIDTQEDYELAKIVWRQKREAGLNQ